VLQDFDRFFDPMVALEVNDAAERIEELVQAVQVLESGPLIGRPVSGGNRELVIGTGTPGHVALYRFVPEFATAFVLAFRRQRESGLKRRR
jgi:toxin ParE1/3/4